MDSPTDRRRRRRFGRKVVSTGGASRKPAAGDVRGRRVSRAAGRLQMRPGKGRIAGGGAGVGGGGEMGMKRVVNTPSRQPFSPYTGPPRFGGEICELTVPRAGFTGALKKFYGPVSFEGSVLYVFKVSNSYRAVILRVWAFCGLC